MKTPFLYSNRIGYLMILSQLVLFVFTGHWIYSQYLAEKNDLEKDLGRHFADAKLQVVDSMLLTHLINPILKDEKGFKMRIQVSEEEDSKHTIKWNEDKSQAIAYIKKNDSVPAEEIRSGNILRQIDIDQHGDSANNVLVKSVKLIYDEVQSSINPDNFEENTLNNNIDTLLLKKLFSENLKKNGINLPSRWVSHESNATSLTNERSLYFESRLFPFAYGVEFSRFEGYLIQRIIPQILFAIVLLLLTGTAFYIAHKSLKDQMRLSELKNDFISNISHELKTPVSTVKVAIEALQDPRRMNREEKVKEYLNIAALEISRLEQIINKVLDTSTLEGRKNMVQPESVLLEDLINEVLQTMQYRISEAGAKVTLGDNFKSLKVTMDKLHVQGVLINLIDNSLKYGIDGKEIRIEVEKNPEHTIIKVSDNGPGIPAEYLNKVFEKFFRVPNKNIHNVKGSGLGLSYAALVMKQHMGSIEVRNREVQGCIFILKFPA